MEDNNLLKAGLGIAKNAVKKKILIKVGVPVAAVLLPLAIVFICILAFFSWLDWSKDEPKMYDPYIKVASEHMLSWQELFAIDWANAEGDLDNLNPKAIEDAFVYYVEVEVTVCEQPAASTKNSKSKTESNSEPKCRTEIQKEKRVRSFEQVMDHLNFNEEQREMAVAALEMIYEDSGTSPPSGGPISKIGEREIPSQYIPIYKAAASRYNVPWNLLAAHHRVETIFSTMDPMISKAGAEGHMQFMPCTFIGWAAPGCAGTNGAGSFTESEKSSLEMIARYGGYGVDANGDGKASMWDVQDAIFSAAHLLSKNGASEGRYEDAIFAYNRSQKYVSEVLYFMNLYVDGYDSIDTKPTESGFARPINGRVTSPYGYRTHPVTGEKGKLHAGIDFACAEGQPIPASKAGRVIVAGWQNPGNPKEGYGQYVRIDHGGGYQTTYAHLSSIKVRVGDNVSVGSIVGGCGSTGSSTGNHLHFEILKNGTKVDPAPYIGL